MTQSGACSGCLTPFMAEPEEGLGSAYQKFSHLFCSILEVWSGSEILAVWAVGPTAGVGALVAALNFTGYLWPLRGPAACCVSPTESLPPPSLWKHFLAKSLSFASVPCVTSLAMCTTSLCAGRTPWCVFSTLHTLLPFHCSVPLLHCGFLPCQWELCLCIRSS